MTGSESDVRTPANSITRRVPKRLTVGPTTALPTKPLTPAIDMSRPTSATLMSIRSRISGSRGMNDAKIAPLTKNWTATAPSAL